MSLSEFKKYVSLCKQLLKSKLPKEDKQDVKAYLDQFKICYEIAKEIENVEESKRDTLAVIIARQKYENSHFGFLERWAQQTFEQAKEGLTNEEELKLVNEQLEQTRGNYSVFEEIFLTSEEDVKRRYDKFIAQGVNHENALLFAKDPLYIMKLGVDSFAEEYLE